MLLKRRRLRAVGVVVHHHSIVTNTTFQGTAVVEPYCRIVGTPKITVGDDFYMNAGCHLLGDITFGDSVMLGPKVVMWSRDHGMESGIVMRRQAHINEPIVVGDDVWIGASAVILKGVTVGSGAVIAAGCVVTKDVAQGDIVGGVPARVIGHREPGTVGTRP
jgi:acetyltransferase-like isoleucine patch superfamily enzyme